MQRPNKRGLGGIKIKYQLVKADYDKEGNSNDIFFYARDENGFKKKIRILGFQPYFYVPTGEQVFSPNIVQQKPFKCPSVYNEDLDIIFTKQPRHVGELRDQFSRHYEADIQFPFRFMLDRNIFSGFELPENKTIVKYEKVVPCEINLKPRIVVCDIETFSKGVRYPKATESQAEVTINCFYDYKTDFYLSFAIDPEKKLSTTWDLSPNHKAIIVKSEKDLIQKTDEYLKYIDPDIFTAWYVGFDKEFLDIRAEKQKTKFPWERIDVFDMLTAYRKLYNKGSNKLGDVIEMEKLEVPNYEPFQHKFWETDLKKAVLVNKSHVEALVLLNNKLRLLEFYYDLKVLVGLESMGGTVYHGILVETMLLRRYHNKFVLPSKPSDDEKKRRKLRKKEKVGGKVFEPPFGIFEEVGVFDMSRYYPEMLISQNLSPEPHEGKIGVIPQLALDLIEERLKYDRKLRKFKPGTPEYDEFKMHRKSVKYITEAIIGELGHEPARLFDLDAFNKVTTQGQRGLFFLQGKCKEDGHRFIYGDSVIGNTVVPICKDGIWTNVQIAKLFDKYKSDDRFDGKGIAILKKRLYTYAIDRYGVVKKEKIKKIIYHKTETRFFEVGTVSGKSVTVTKDHSIIGWDGQEIQPLFPSALDDDSIVMVMDNSNSKKERIAYVRDKGQYEDCVYDLEVEHCHTFLANNIFVHNTDSSFIQIPKEQAHDYVETLNEELKKFGKQEGIKRELSLKLDYWFKKVMFKKYRKKIDGVWKERGAKKKYAGRVGWQDGKDVDYLHIKGFEYVRRNSSKETKRLQPVVIDLVLSDKPMDEIKKELSIFIKDETKKYEERIKNGELTLDDIAIPTTLSKSLSKYGREKDGKTIAIPDYVRGAIYCNEWFASDIRVNDQVKMVYVNKVVGYPPTDVISYLSQEDVLARVEVNIEKMVERCIRGTLEDIMELAGLTWDDVFRPSRSLFNLGG